MDKLVDCGHVIPVGLKIGYVKLSLISLRKSFMCKRFQNMDKHVQAQKCFDSCLDWL